MIAHTLTSSMALSTMMLISASMSPYNVDACPNGLVAKVASSTQDDYCAYEVSGLGHYPYMGCFKDRSSSDGRVMVAQDGAYTLIGCIEKCAEGEYDYAGLQWYTQCFCGKEDEHRYDSLGNADNCNIECSATGYEEGTICGGNLANSVYKTESHLLCPPSNVVTQIDGEDHCSYDGFQYMGCFKDQSSSDGGHTMVGQDGAYTLDGCIEQCAAQGYAYAGLQWCTQCWCGHEDEYRYDSLGPAVNCNIECSAEGYEEGTICGGNLANSVYSTTFTG